MRFRHSHEAKPKAGRNPGVMLGSDMSQGYCPPLDPRASAPVRVEVVRPEAPRSTLIPREPVEGRRFSMNAEAKRAAMAMEKRRLAAVALLETALARYGHADGRRALESALEQLR